MIAAIRLGARLALGSSGQRGRSLLVALAAGVGTLVLLSVLAVAAAEGLRAGDSGYSASELGRLTTAVVLAVALPVVTLAATVGRLSAAIRDRRLANLRLLGLAPLQTRVVAAVEAGVAATAGTALGTAAFWLLRPVLAAADLGGRQWSTETLRPGLLGVLVGVLAVPTVIVGIASLPRRLDTRRALDRARRRDARRPSLLLAAPLLTGLAVSAYSWRLDDDHELSGADITVFFGGIVLLGLGIVVVVPVFVRLLADVLLRASRGPVTLLAARRLQAQPAVVTRIVAALMIGLFLVVGARAVVVAFEDTPQYRSASAQIEHEQRAAVPVPNARLPRFEQQVRGLTGVREVTSVVQLQGSAGGQVRNGGMQVRAIVGTCADLRRFAPAVTTCSDAEPMTLAPWWAPADQPRRVTLMPTRTTFTGDDDRRLTVPLPAADSRETYADYSDLDPVYADVFIPLGYSGVERLLPDADRTLWVAADPGRDLSEEIGGLGIWPETLPDIASYDFVASLRTIVWTVAAVILSVGLLTFAVAGIDRVLSRRRELVALQLLGTRPSTLRRAQWLESALPVAVGALLAIAAGWFAGGTYLQLGGEETGHAPWAGTFTLTAVALVAAVVIAGLTVVATNVRISPDHVRVE